MSTIETGVELTSSHQEPIGSRLSFLIESLQNLVPSVMGERNRYRWTQSQKAANP
jgi:hypothetical protein